MSYQSLVDFNGWTLIAQILNLFIQIYLFKRFLFKPVKKIFEQRQQEVDSLYADAEKAKLDAETAKESYETHLQTASAEASEITQKLMTGEAEVAMLPVPAATALLMKDPGVRQALDLSAEWDAVSSTPLPMGCIVARREFVEEHPEAVDAFLDLYGDSISFMSDEGNRSEAAELVAKA